MAGTLVASPIQINDNATATNNFHFATDNAGGLVLYRGNAGTTTTPLLTVDSSGNVATKQSAKAFAKCTLSGATLTQRKAFNCTVTRASTGTYNVAFTTAMEDANFSVGMAYSNSGWGQTFAVDSETINGFRMVCASAAGAVADPTAFSFVVFD